MALKKAHGNLGRTIERMEKSRTGDKDCFAVLQQNLAVIGLIKAANRSVLSGHLDAVLSASPKTAVARRKLRDELLKIIEKSQK